MTDTAPDDRLPHEHHVDQLRSHAAKARPTSSYAGLVARTVRDHLDEILEAERMVGQAYAAGRVAELERRVTHTEERLDTTRGWLTEANARVEFYRDLYEQKRAITRQETADGEERVTVKLSHDPSAVWTVADLEEVAYRFRLGGGSDDTEVRLERSGVAASLPSPNLISLHPVGRRERPSVVATSPEQLVARALAGNRSGKGAAFAVVAVVLVLVVWSLWLVSS